MRLLLLTLLVLLLTASLRADDAAEQEFFEKRGCPILVEHCFECHSAKTKPLKGGLRLYSREGLMAGGDSGAAVVPGDSEKSRLVVAVGYESEELQMAPAGEGARAQVECV